MTTYSGDKIKLAPDAAVYDVSVTRSQTGTQGVYTLTLSGTFVATDTLVIDGTSITAGNTAAASVAGAVTSAMSANTNYTVTNSGAAITFTEKAGHYGVGMPAWEITTTGSGKGTAATTTEGVSTEKPVNSPSTFVDRLGVLHAGKNLKAGDTITVSAKCTYINPSGETSPLTDEITIAVA